MRYYAHRSPLAVSPSPPSFDRALGRLRGAARDLDLIATPRDLPAARGAAVDAFDRVMRLLYAAGCLPADAEVRAALAACGTGAARTVPVEWGRAHFVHQFWTSDGLDALAAYLRGVNLTPIVEVGAGRGELARWLRARGVPVIATDDGSWLDGRLNWPRGLAADVAPLDYRSALAVYRPALVLCAWMPLGEDWTPAFRASPSVREYLLLGEGPGGGTGTPASFDAPAPWTRTSLDALARWCLTRNVDRHFQTVVERFRR